MANPLGELFGNIAASIRKGLGDVGKMKPSSFPSRVEEIVSLITDGGAMDAEIDRAIDIINGEAINGKEVTFMVNGEVWFTLKVSPGTDCPDPIDAGYMRRPAKESTVSHSYTFSGWSLESDGAVDANALKAVNEDRTVYAVFKASPRTYPVYFYDGDTLLKTSYVAYGNSASYTPKKDGYIFVRWEPSCNRIEGATTCYAQWKVSDKLSYYTWSQLAEIAESGEANTRFQVGDTKNLIMTVNSVDYQLKAMLIGFNHDDLADGTGKAGMTFEVVDMPKIGIEHSPFNFYPTSKAYTEFGQYAHTYVYADLSPFIKQVIKTCYKQSKDDPGYYALNAYMWTIALRELNFKLNDSRIPDDGQPYEYYTDKERTTVGVQEYPELFRYRAEGEISTTNGKVNWHTRSPITTYGGTKNWGIGYREGQAFANAYETECSTILCFCL